jgi:hypothetical protein
MSNAVRADALGCERGHIGSRLDSVTLYDRVNAETRQGLPTAIEEYPFLRWTLASEVAQLLHGVGP